MMNNIFNYNQFNENINNIITLYHGKKWYSEKFIEFDFNIFPYFYLTPNYKYALYYSKNNPEFVLEFKIDTSKIIIDLTCFIGGKNYTYEECAKIFYKKTKNYIPCHLRRFFPCSFWEVVRLDKSGSIGERLIDVGIDGFKMNEIGNGGEQISYVLLNNNPIIKQIKESKENHTIVYRGAPSPEFGKGNWNGVFVSNDLKSATQYHNNVYKYELFDSNLLDEDDPKAEKIADDWLDNSNDPDIQYVNEIYDLWMFPPDGWINYLKKLGYDGTSFGFDRFIFNTDKLKFIGKINI